MSQTTDQFEDKVRRLLGAFDSRPLLAEQTDLYVELDDVRGKADVVERLFNRITRTQHPTSQLLSGHKGSGKSTELRRLQKKLNTFNYFTVLVTEQDFDPKDVKFLEVIVVLLQRLAQELKIHRKVRLQPGYFATVFKRFFEFLNEPVTVDSIEFETMLGKIGLAIRSNPSARDQLRELLEARTSTIQSEANKLIGDAAETLKKDGCKGIVVIFDSLDRMSDHAQATELFLRRANEMTGFNCHVIYTIPLSLAYSERFTQLRLEYGGQPPVIPMIKLHTRPPLRERHEDGYKKFGEIIEKRLKSVGLSEMELFASADIRDAFIALTGGQPTQLMTFVQDALNANDLPIDEEAINRLVREQKRDFRWLLQEHWPIIESIRSSGTFQPTAATEPIFLRLLDARVILQYVNDDEWYDLNPLVARMVPPFTELKQ